MYAIIGMGEETQNIEIPCMFFETRQAAETHLSQIPWLQRCENKVVVYDDGAEDSNLYVLSAALYDKTIPPFLRAALPQTVIDRAEANLTYGKAAGLHFFTHYDDRRQRVVYYLLIQVESGEALAGFGELS